MVILPVILNALKLLAVENESLTPSNCNAFPKGWLQSTTLITAVAVQPLAAV
jgi:hypothetical protein